LFKDVGMELTEQDAGEAAETTPAESARIMESVKNETASDDKDLSPDGLAYNVSSFELEVERCVGSRGKAARGGVQMGKWRSGAHRSVVDHLCGTRDAGFSRSTAGIQRMAFTSRMRSRRSWSRR